MGVYADAVAGLDRLRGERKFGSRLAPGLVWAKANRTYLVASTGPVDLKGIFARSASVTQPKESL